MVNQQLLSYVEQQLAAGVAKADLLKTTAAAGWAAVDISDTFAAAEGRAPTPAPAPAPVAPVLTPPVRLGQVPTQPVVKPPVQQPVAPVALDYRRGSAGTRCRRPGAVLPPRRARADSFLPTFFAAGIYRAGSAGG